MRIYITKDNIENICTTVSLEGRHLLEDALTSTTQCLAFTEADSSRDIYETLASHLSYAAQNNLACKRYHSARDMVFVLSEAQQLLYNMFAEEMLQEEDGDE